MLRRRAYFGTKRKPITNQLKFIAPMEYIHFLWFPWLKMLLVILGLNGFQCLTVITLP